VLVKLINRFLLDFKSANVLVLDLLDTFEDIFHTSFMARQRGSIRPIASDAIDDEVVLALVSLMSFRQVMRAQWRAAGSQICYVALIFAKTS
jgi:hypothetical protein